MNKLTARLERDLREVAAGAQPSPSAWASIEARLDDGAEPEPALVLPLARETQKRPVWSAVAAAALLAITGSIAVLTRAGDDHSSFAAELTSTFDSPTNGYSIKHPAGAVITPATESGEDGFDVVDTGLGAVFEGTSTEFTNEAGVDETHRTIEPDEQIDHYFTDAGVYPGGCGVPRSQQAEIPIDGRTGRIAECPNRIEATVVTGGKLYVFILSHERSDARTVFDAFVATIELTPETAVHFPAMATTFDSPAYGYSFGYVDRGGLEPATELWDVTNQQYDDDDFYDQFDFFDTGFGAGFHGASTGFPEGVSIDRWVDEYVTPAESRNCGIPRNQQAEITIDGQSGRIAECPNHIEATVVAGGRLYLFTMVHQRSDARAWFYAWVTTIDLTPETAAVP